MLSCGRALQTDRNPAIKNCSAFKLALVRVESAASRSHVLLLLSIDISARSATLDYRHKKNILHAQVPAEPAFLQSLILLTFNDNEIRPKRKTNKRQILNTHANKSAFTRTPPS